MSQRQKYAYPKGKVSYEDSSVSGKTYVDEDRRSSVVSAHDTPFGLSSFLSVFRRPPQPRQLDKMRVQVSEQHAKVPVTDESGKRFFAHFFDVKYQAPGELPMVTKSDGSTGVGPMPFMMAPGMKKQGKGQYDPYGVSPEDMSREQSDFSYFTEL